MIRYRPLHADLWPDLVTLFGSRGACGGCWCQWWRVERGGRLWEETKGRRARARMRAMVADGRARGIIAFDGEAPVGWCSFGPRTDFPRLETVKAYRRADSGEVWSVVCFFVTRSHRGRGVARGLLQSALDAMRKLDVRTVEAYPVTTTRSGERLAAAFSWTGPLQIFAAAGFEEVQCLSPGKPVVRLCLDSSGQRCLRLVHWNEAEGRSRVERLRELGFEVAFDMIRSGADLPRLRQPQPDAVVIDLGRLPMQGRDVGIALRRWKATRDVPVVFVGGSEDKIARVRTTLPDALFTTWGTIRKALDRALAAAPAAPVVPASILAGYSGTPLAEKLGIKPGSTLALLGAPADFEQTLGSLPDDVRIRRDVRGKWDLAIWFPPSRKELERRIAKLAPRPGTALWIAWPKQAAKRPTDLTQKIVRDTGLAAGLVDHKICAIDQTWSGLRFVTRGKG